MSENENPTQIKEGVVVEMKYTLTTVAHDGNLITYGSSDVKSYTLNLPFCGKSN